MLELTPRGPLHFKHFIQLVKGGTIFSKNVEWRKFSTQITVSQYLIPFEV